MYNLVKNRWYRNMTTVDLRVVLNWARQIPFMMFYYNRILALYKQNKKGNVTLSVTTHNRILWLLT
jgi:hypothetical protein